MPNPVVSIGMPIYNEQKFLVEALESLAKQNYQNIELIISDNASTDETEKICQTFVKKYDFIKYVRLEENIGAAANFRSVQKLATGKYFMWAAGHDLWSENLISECVSVLENYDGAVIAFATSEWVNESSGKTTTKTSGWTDTRGMHAVDRFNSVLWGNMHPILGLIRNSSLIDSKEFQSILGADLVMLCELALKGDFVHAVNAKWCRRVFRNEETYKQRLQRYKSASYKQIDPSFIPTPAILKLPLEITKTIFRSTLPFHIKTLTFVALLPAMFLKYVISR